MSGGLLIVLFVYRLIAIILSTSDGRLLHGCLLPPWPTCFLLDEYFLPSFGWLTDHYTRPTFSLLAT
jgi:hypothetical protein